MNIQRRDFIKGCARVSLLMIPGMASVAASLHSNAASVQGADLRIEKSIKAGFGGGFSVRAHSQSNGLTYAEIEHLGNRYSVVSADLVDWKIRS